MNIDDLLTKVKKIHFIGIGGSGMCPIAEILREDGFELTGSDTSESDTLQRIRNYGIKVYTKHEAKNVEGSELVVYTAAVKADNPELIRAKELGIPAYERCEMLGAVTRRYNRSVAISGTHGKTTTTGMLTQILIASGFDPSAIIGGKLPYIGSNGYVGKSDIIVCEACEYVDTFLHLDPAISVILNIDSDHLDYFGTLENIKKSFNKFAHKTKNVVILNGDDKNTLDAVNDLNIPIITYGFDENNDYYAANITCDTHAQQQFDLFEKGKKLTTITLSVPGKHNIYNALAAATAAIYLGATPAEVSRSLHKFTGVHRRFEILGKPKGITIADDFAHHPTELRATLTAAKSMGFNSVWAVFQPHTYSRTAMFLNEFAEVLSIADHCVLSEILAVREENTYNIFSSDLAEKIPGCVWFKDFDEITDYVCKNAKKGDLIITLGGGNVYMCADKILKKLSSADLLFF